MLLRLCSAMGSGAHRRRRCFALRRCMPHSSAGSLDGITDESSAIERNGSFPRLVLGSATNIKVTTEQDLMLARAILDLRSAA